MSDLYLILHKVRGSPAFDIATRLPIGDEEGWIIPTSGHRAYPIAEIELTHLVEYGEESSWIRSCPTIPASWPDHYAPAKAPPAPSLSLTSLLPLLGLSRKPVKRRKV